MGEMADFYSFYDEFDICDPTISWVDQNGYEVYISDMTDKHLINTINLIYRNWVMLKKKGSLGKLKAEDFDSIGDLNLSYWPLIEELYDRCKKNTKHYL